MKIIKGGLSDNPRAAGHLNSKVIWVPRCLDVGGALGTSEDLAWRYDEVIIKFKAKAKLW